MKNKYTVVSEAHKKVLVLLPRQLMRNSLQNAICRNCALLAEIVLVKP